MAYSKAIMIHLKLASRMFDQLVVNKIKQGHFPKPGCLKLKQISCVKNIFYPNWWLSPCEKGSPTVYQITRVCGKNKLQSSTRYHCTSLNSRRDTLLLSGSHNLDNRLLKFLTPFVKLHFPGLKVIVFLHIYSESEFYNPKLKLDR